jgi:hypothetical protein
MYLIQWISLTISLIFLIQPILSASASESEPSFDESRIIPVTSVENAFTRIFDTYKKDPKKRIALSLDFDDTISLNKERLQRHYDHALKQKEPRPIDFAVKHAVENLNKIYLPIQNTSLLNWLINQHIDKLMSPSYPEYIQQAIDHGISVFITTARNGTEFDREALNKDLAVLNLKFNRDRSSQLDVAAMAQTAKTWGAENLTGSLGSHKILPYFDRTNVLYTSGWDKGPVLKTYLQDSPIKFDIIFHLDDQLYQINSVLNTLRSIILVQALWFQPEQLQLFPDINALNDYINREIQPLLHTYQIKKPIDWTDRDHIDELLANLYELSKSLEELLPFDEPEEFLEISEYTNYYE